MNQDTDPIADREAKIMAWRKGAILCPWAGEYLLTDAEIDEAVALMRSAPDGGPEPAPAAEIDRLRAENERLRSVLAAVDTSLCRFAQSTTLLVEDDHRGGLLREQRIEGMIDKVRQLELQRSTALDQRDEALAENARLQADLAAARADQAAMARRELEHLQFDLCCPYPDAYQLTCRRLAALPAQQPEPKPKPVDCAFRGGFTAALTDEEREAQRQSWAISAAEKAEGRNTVLMKPKPEFCGALIRVVTGGTCANTKPCPTHDAEPVQWMAAGPEPDAATRDGDEVLRGFLARDDSGAGMTIDEAVMRELCRRELARGK